MGSKCQNEGKNTAKQLVCKYQQFPINEEYGSKIIGGNSVYNYNETHKILFERKYQTHLKQSKKLTERSKTGFNKEAYHVPE